MKEDILSVGIDIGTSTTQVIFSCITIENLASDFSVPRVEIIGRKIIYKSPIHFTPLKSSTEIDMLKVKDIVEDEYRNAKIDKNLLKTGAVVITGETARKENANQVVHFLSGFAGDFVVATAGPDLESILAGRGAGADLYSQEKHTTACNCDIGGGTSNYALFKNGEVVGTSCLDIGGRLLKIDTESNKITYISPKIKKLAEYKFINLIEGAAADPLKLEQCADAMAEILAMGFNIIPKSKIYYKLLTLQGSELPDIKINNISFSGGVSDYIYSENSSEDIYKYGDIGIILAS